MNYQKRENIYLKLVSNCENWMDAFRQNIGILRTFYGWSVRVLADKADISENTINKIIQGKTNDCDTSLVIKLARTFNCSVDELIGAKTLEEETQKVIAMSRHLSKHHRKVIGMYAKHQYELHGDNDSDKKSISILQPMCKNGYLKTTTCDKKYFLKDLSKPIQEKVGMGIRLPCDHYEPHFYEGEVILLGFDREGNNNEMCVISSGGNMYHCLPMWNF